MWMERMNACELARLDALPGVQDQGAMDGTFVSYPGAYSLVAVSSRTRRAIYQMITSNTEAACVAAMSTLSLSVFSSRHWHLVEELCLAGLHQYCACPQPPTRCAQGFAC